MSAKTTSPKFAECQMRLRHNSFEPRIIKNGEFAFKRRLAVQTTRGNGFAGYSRAGLLAAAPDRLRFLRACYRDRIAVGLTSYALNEQELAVVRGGWRRMT